MKHGELPIEKYISKLCIIRYIFRFDTVVLFKFIYFNSGLILV